MDWQYIPTESSSWSKRSRHGINSRCIGAKWVLRSQIGRNKVSMESTANGLAVHTHWGVILVEARSVWNQQPMEWGNVQASERSNWSTRGQYGMNRPWNVITYGLRVETRSVWNEQLMESGNVPSERRNSSKRGRYGMNSQWNVITHRLSIQIGRSEVSME